MSNFEQLTKKIFILVMFLLLVGIPGICQDFKTLVKQGDMLWNQRDNTEKLRQCIEAYEDAIDADPKNEETWVKLSHAYYHIGAYNLTKNAEKKASFINGINAAKKALEINPQSVGGNFWLVGNMLKIDEFRGIVRSVSDTDTVLKHMDIVKAGDPDYYYGGYYRLWGKIIYSTPSYLLKAANTSLLPKKYRKNGGYREDDQIEYLATAVKIEPNYFMNHVWLAESYLKLRKTDQAKRELEWVLNTPSDVLPEATCENRYWKEEAKKLLQKMPM